MAFVVVDNVTRRYDAHVLALGGVSLEIAAGEWVAIMGPSGSGKTTLLNILGGLDVPDEGRVLVGGEEIGRLGPKELARYRRETVGLVFQQFHLIPYLSALENVMLAQYLHSLADREEAAAALREVGLGDRLGHLPAQLSGGEKQRVCIARALINQPKLLLADEPTGNLDAENEAIVLDLCERMNRRGQTIVMVTHDMSVGRRAHRQIQLDHGRLAGYFLSPQQETEDIDEVLEHLWLVEEGSPIAADVCGRGAMLAASGLLERMQREQLILIEGERPRFTPEGARRAELLVRRHRLAEKLFSETFQLEAKRVEEEACYFEHILSAAMTDGICGFLGHPQTCPHGKPIPSGPCCPRSGDTDLILGKKSA